MSEELKPRQLYFNDLPLDGYTLEVKGFDADGEIMIRIEDITGDGRNVFLDPRHVRDLIKFLKLELAK